MSVPPALPMNQPDWVAYNTLSRSADRSYVRVPSTTVRASRSEREKRRRAGAAPGLPKPFTVRLPM